MLTIIALAIILTIIVGNIFYTSFIANEISSQQTTTADIDNKVSDLSKISNDYFLFQNNSQLIAWQNTVNGISTDISNFSTTDSQQQQIVNTIQNDLAIADNAFNKTTVYLQNTPRNFSARTDPQFQVLWNQLTQSILMLSKGVDDLTQLLHNETIQNQNSTINLIVIMLLAFLGFILITYYISYRHTLKSVAELQKGLHIIGKGNLDYSIKIRKNDEISEISQSVNNMTIQLRDLTNNLKNQERMAAIGQTAGMVGHDIRNPLQAITSDLFLAKTELEDTPNSEQKRNALESLDEIEKNIDYINKIVQDLQDYARPRNPKAEKSDIIEIIERITKDSKPSNIQVSLKVAEEARKIQADSYYLNRIFYNLITNAIQAMPKGGNILIESKKEGNDVVLLVTDTGVGIPEEVQAKLFSVMFTTKSKGQGFGLPVVKRMTESLGGTVTFESQVGKGTTFIVRLPQ